MRDSRRFFYDTIADRFDILINAYDTNRRLEIVFDELLAGEKLEGRSVLDVGAGTGWFSLSAARRGARVTSLDIGVELLKRTRLRCRTAVVAGDACVLPLASNTFDVVVSSECIEHTVDPLGALREIHRVTRPGGLIVVTVPNQAWHFAATFAEKFHLRPFEGYENWVRWRDLRETLTELGASIDVMRGFHLIPPLVRPMTPALRWADRFGQRLGRLMLNLAVRARKASGG